MNPSFTPEHLRVFRSAYLFKTLNPEELSFFLDTASLVRISSNGLIIRENDPGEQLFLILSGKVRVTKHAFENIEQILGILKPGDFFGEMVLLDRKKRSASVFAHTDVELAGFRYSDVSRIMNEYPRVGMAVLKAFSEVISLRLRDADDKLRALTFIEKTF